MPPDAVPGEGRDIHCAKCGKSWFQAGQADAGEAPARDAPLAEGVPDFGTVEVPAMPLGPAVEMPSNTAEPDPEALAPWVQTERSRAGLGTMGWVLLFLVVALIAAGAYAWMTGLLKLPA